MDLLQGELGRRSERAGLARRRLHHRRSRRDPPARLRDPRRLRRAASRAGGRRIDDSRPVGGRYRPRRPRALSHRPLGDDREAGLADCYAFMKYRRKAIPATRARVFIPEPTNAVPAGPASPLGDRRPT